MPNENHVTRSSVRSEKVATDPQLDPNAAESAGSSFADALFGTDPPIEKAHPGLQPALVFASYPLALILLISIVGFYFLFFRSSPRDVIVSPVPTEPTEQSASMDNAR